MINSVVKGDLIKRAMNGKYNAIAHGCNCLCTMGAGIARAIKDIWPSAYQADLATEKGAKEKLGSYSFANVTGFTIINAYTQYDFRRKADDIMVDYEAVRKVFTRINSDFAGKHIGIPKIGAGLAGGDWQTIATIINEVTPDIDIELVEFA